jgi:hypothetical protein
MHAHNASAYARRGQCDDEEDEGVVEMPPAAFMFRPIQEEVPRRADVEEVEVTEDGKRGVELEDNDEEAPIIDAAAAAPTSAPPGRASE